MDEQRIKRYKDKINLINKRTVEIEEWTNISSSEFLNDEKTKLATYKAFQELAESCMDIIAMICKDEKIIPKDDYKNIDSLNKTIRFNGNILKDINGLRNRIIHRYNSTDDLMAFQSIKELTTEISTFIKEVNKWIKKSLTK